MKTLVKNNTLKILVCAVAAALVIAVFAIYVASGASALKAVTVWAVGAAAGIYIPGLLIKDIFFGEKAKGIEFTVVAVSGFTFFALVTLVASYAKFYILVPAATGCAVALYMFNLYKNRAYIKNVKNKFNTTTAFLVLIAAVLVLLNALWSVRYAHPETVGQIKPSQDFFWNLGNAQSILKAFPVADLRVSGVTLSYHFLTELLQAGLCMLAGVPVYDTVAFYAYAPVALALTGCLYELGRTLLGENDAVNTAFAAMPLWLGCASLHKVMENGLSRFGNNIAIHTISNINGQTTAFFALAAFLTLFKKFFDTSDGEKTAGLILAGCAFLLLAFSKSPQAAIIAIAFAAAVIVFCFVKLATKQFKTSTKSMSKAVFGLFITVGFLLLYKLYFAAGANSSMSFSLTATLKSHYFANIVNLVTIKLPSLWKLFLPLLYAAQSFFMAPAIFVVWVLTGLYDLFHLKKVSVTRLMLHAVTAGGLVAFYIFEHYSSSQVYFANIALFCGAVISAQTIIALWNCKTEKAKLAGMVTAFLKASVVVMLLLGIITNGLFAVYLASSALDYINGNGVTETHISVTKAEEQACEWLAEQMSNDMYFATNRMHTGHSLEGLSNIYSGLSGEQAYCESFKYAVSNMGDQGGAVYEKYYQMCELFEGVKTQQEIIELCRQCNVYYIIYNPLSPGTDELIDFMPLVYQQDDIKIYKVE